MKLLSIIADSKYAALPPSVSLISIARRIRGSARVYDVERAAEGRMGGTGRMGWDGVVVTESSCGFARWKRGS